MQPSSLLASPASSHAAAATLRRLGSLHPPPAIPPAAPAAALPVLSIAGGGVYFFWKAGVLKYLLAHHDLCGVRLRGASAGALIAALAACEVDLDAAVVRAHELAQEHGVYDRPMGLAGVWGGLIRRWLQELLPEDCHLRCSGRVQVCVTALPTLRPLLLQHFASKEDLVEACMASVHIPFFLDGRLAADVRGLKAVDGCIGCMFSARLPALSLLSSLLAVGGWGLATRRRKSPDPGPTERAPGLAASASLTGLHGLAPFGRLLGGCDSAAQQGQFVLDYSLDENLGFSRLGFLKLLTLEGVQQLVQRGFEYGQRMQAQGVWAARLGLAVRVAAEEAGCPG